MYFNEQQTENFKERADLIHGNNSHKIMTVLTKDLESFIPGERNIVIITPDKKSIDIIAIGVLHNPYNDSGVIYSKFTNMSLISNYKACRRTAAYIIKNHFTCAKHTTIIVLHGKEEEKLLTEAFIKEFRFDDRASNELINSYLSIGHIIKNLFCHVRVNLPVITFSIGHDKYVQIRRIGNKTQMMSYEHINKDTTFPRLLKSKGLHMSSLATPTGHFESILKILGLVKKSYDKKVNDKALQSINSILSAYEHIAPVTKWNTAIYMGDVMIIFAPMKDLIYGRRNKVIYSSSDIPLVLLNTDHPLVIEALEKHNEKIKKSKDMITTLDTSTHPADFDGDVSLMLGTTAIQETTDKKDTDGDVQNGFTVLPHMSSGYLTPKEITMPNERKEIIKDQLETASMRKERIKKEKAIKKENSDRIGKDINSGAMNNTDATKLEKGQDEPSDSQDKRQFTVSSQHLLSSRSPVVPTSEVNQSTPNDSSKS